MSSSNLKQCLQNESGKKKGPKPKLFGPNIFGWGGGLPRERVGAKKFGTSLETQETKLFGGISRDFAQDFPGAPEKFEKKTFVFDFYPLMTWSPNAFILKRKWYEKQQEQS